MLGGNAVVRWLQVLRHWLNRNTKRQARKNIHAHYDLGNAFYSAWLDPTMTYSSALFDSGSADLTAAQLRKYQSLAQSIDLKHEQSVLEIGCGWGGFAEYAAKTYDARVVGLTISREQHDFARRRVFEAGLADKVKHRISVPVVDPIAAAVRQAETLVVLAPRKATTGTFRRPDAKSTKGLSEALARRIEHREEPADGARFEDPRHHRL